MVRYKLRNKKPDTVRFIAFFYPTVRLQEIQYRAKGLASTTKKTKSSKHPGAAMFRGPYKCDEHVLKDEQLLQTLREYTGREENFEFPRLEEQQKLFAKFKQGVLLSLSLSMLSLFLLCRRPHLSP